MQSGQGGANLESLFNCTLHYEAIEASVVAISPSPPPPPPPRALLGPALTYVPTLPPPPSQEVSLEPPLKGTEPTFSIA